MPEPRPGRWKRRVLAAALIVPAVGAALWFGNLWRLTRERDRLLAAAERFGPVAWRDLAEQTLAEDRRNPGAAEEFLAAITQLGGEYGRRTGIAEVIDDDTRDWLDKPAAGALPEHAAKAFVRGQEALRRLHAVVGKPPGLLTTELLVEQPWSILLRHIQDMRAAARLFQLEARAAEQAKDARRAYRAALSATLLSRQLQRDPCLITWLVGRAVESVAAQHTLPSALRTGPPTAEEFRALDAAWVGAAPVETLARALRMDLAMMLAVTRRANDWRDNRRMLVQVSPNQPRRSTFQEAVLWLEGTAAGEPVRLRAESALLAMRLALERQLESGRDLADVEFPPPAPEHEWMFPSGRWIVSMLPRRRANAFAARLALRLARRWHETGTLPERWEEACDAALPQPDPKRLGGTLGYERRPRGFTLLLPAVAPPPGQPPPELERIAVDFAPPGRP